MNGKRIYTARPDDQRCTSDRKPLSDGSGARCMLPRIKGDPRGLCRVHAKLQVSK